MAATLVTLAAGVVFGVALAAPPGPMNAIIAEESVLRGWFAGFKAGLGAMSADAIFFVLAALGVVAFVEQYPLIRAVMVGIGGVLMLYFAYDAASDVQSSFRGSLDAGPDAEGATDAGTTADGKRAADAEATPDVGAGTGFRKAFVLALTNPYQVLFWLTVGVGLLEPGRVDVLGATPYVGTDLAGLLVVETGTPALLVGFFLGIGIWIVVFPASLVTAGRRLERFARTVAYLSAAVLAGFGLWFLGDAVRTF